MEFFWKHHQYFQISRLEIHGSPKHTRALQRSQKRNWSLWKMISFEVCLVTYSLLLLCFPASKILLSDLEKSHSSWEIAKITKAKMNFCTRNGQIVSKSVVCKRNWRDWIFLETPSVFPDFKTWNSWISSTQNYPSTLSKEKFVLMKNAIIWGMSCHLTFFTSMFSRFKNFT